MHLYLIRHAESFNNSLPESQRVEDPGITPVGISQSELLARRMRTERITHLLTSGFRRALETARPLAAALQLRPAIWTDLHEMGGCYRGFEPGALQGRPGMSRAELESEYPEFEVPEDIDHQGWWKSKPHESREQAADRAEQQFRRIEGKFGGTGAAVACVIHADFKRLMLERIMPDRFSGTGNGIANTGITLFHFEGAMPNLLLLNDTTHLATEQVTS